MATPKLQKEGTSEINQLIGGNDFDATEMQTYLEDTLQNFIDLRRLPEPYYNWDSLTDKWSEFDRCYEMRAKSDRADYEYKGASNIVLPDFHANIETLKTREMNALFSGADQFDAIPTKYSTSEDAIIAKRLVKQNFKLVEDFRNENEKVVQDRLVYGTCMARAEYTEDEIKHQVMIDDVLDEDGNPTEIDGIAQKTPEPYEAWEIKLKKYTDFEHIDLKRVYMHNRIEHMKNHECVFVFQKIAYPELLAMEEDGLISNGMADYIKDNTQEVTDPDLDDAEDSRSEDDNEMDHDVNRVFDIYITLFYFGKGEERKLYEGIYLKDDKLAGLRIHPAANIGEVLIKECYISIPGHTYGIGVGDEQYPSYISKCARFNQIFDLSSFEIKGGGLKDPRLIPNKTLNDIMPGQYVDVPGLAAHLKDGTKPLLSWADMATKRPSESGLTVVDHLNEAMQRGTGATNLLSGMPTNSDVDKTVGGIKTTIDAGNERVNAYLGRYEQGILKRYAEICYKNYQDNIVPQEDLPAMFDDVDLTYVGSNGETTDISFPDYLTDIDFTFIAVKRVVESEKTIGKMTRFLGLIAQIVGQVAEVMPGLAVMVIEKLNWEYVITEIARSVGLTDLDRLFPQFNPIKELIETKEQLMQTGQKCDTMAQGIETAIQQFENDGNEAAIQVIAQIMGAADEGGDSQDMGGEEQAPAQQV